MRNCRNIPAFQNKLICIRVLQTQSNRFRRYLFNFAIEVFISSYLNKFELLKRKQGSNVKQQVSSNTGLGELEHL